MKFALKFFALSLLLTACGHHDEAKRLSNDAELRQKIVGTWTPVNLLLTAENKHLDPGEGSFTLTLNGRYELASRMIGSNFTNEFRYKGTWEVKDEKLIVTLTETSRPDVRPIGTVERYNIVRLNTEELVYQSSDQTIQLKRKK